MPYQPEAQVGFLNPEGSLGLSELDVGLPKFLVTPLTNIRAEDVASSNESRPVAKRFDLLPLQSRVSGAGTKGHDRANLSQRGGKRTRSRTT